MEPSAPAVGAPVLFGCLQSRADLNGTYGVVTVLDMTRLRAGVEIEERIKTAGTGAGAGAGDVQALQRYGGGACSSWWCHGQGQDSGQQHRSRRGIGRGQGAGAVRHNERVRPASVPGHVVWLHVLSVCRAQVFR